MANFPSFDPLSVASGGDPEGGVGTRSVMFDMPELRSDSDTSDSDESNISRDIFGPRQALAVGSRLPRLSAQTSPSQSEFPGRSYHEFDSFPTEHLHECCICLTTPTEGRVCQLMCSHVYHAGCIDTWLNDNNTCPTCRSAVDPQRVMPVREQSFPPGFPRNMDEFAQFLFGMAMPFAAAHEPAPPEHSPGRPPQPSPVDEERRRASVDSITSYLRSRFHNNAASAISLERLAGVREIFTSLPPSMSLRQLVESQRDIFQVVQLQGGSSAVYVQSQPLPSSNSHMSQCAAAISNYLQTHGHTNPTSAVGLSVLCDVPAIRRVIPSNTTLSAVISSSPSFVVIQRYGRDGAAVFFSRDFSITTAPSAASAASFSRISPSANRGPGNDGSAARTPNELTWDIYATAVRRHLLDCGFTSPENSASVRLLGTVQHLQSLRNCSFPPLNQLLRSYPHLLELRSIDGQPRVWAALGEVSSGIETSDFEDDHDRECACDCSHCWAMNFLNRGYDRQSGSEGMERHIIRFVHKYCVENDYTCNPGISLAEIGSEIRSVGFPKQTGTLSRLLQRRTDLFEVYDNPSQGIYVYAHETPRVINRPQSIAPHTSNVGSVSHTPSEFLSRSRADSSFAAPERVLSSSGGGTSDVLGGRIGELRALFPTTAVDVISLALETCRHNVEAAKELLFSWGCPPGISHSTNEPAIVNGRSSSMSRVTAVRDNNSSLAAASTPPPPLHRPPIPLLPARTAASAAAASTSSASRAVAAAAAAIDAASAKIREAAAAVESAVAAAATSSSISVQALGLLPVALNTVASKFCNDSKSLTTMVSSCLSDATSIIRRTEDELASSQPILASAHSSSSSTTNPFGGVISGMGNPFVASASALSSSTSNPFGGVFSGMGNPFVASASALSSSTSNPFGGVISGMGNPFVASASALSSSTTNPFGGVFSGMGNPFVASASALSSSTSNPFGGVFSGMGNPFVASATASLVCSLQPEQSSKCECGNASKVSTP